MIQNRPRGRQVASHAAPSYRPVPLYGGYQPVSQPAVRSHARRTKLVVSLIVLGMVGLFAHGTWSKHVAAQAAATRAEQAQQVAEAAQKSAVFTSEINDLMAANPNITFSVAITSSHSTIKSFGSANAFNGASTGKLITAADYLNRVEHGKASLSQKIDGRSAQELLKLMIINSDDVAWQSLNDYLTHADLERYAKTIGLTDYDADSDSFTAVDIASLLQKLQAGRLLTAAHRSLLLGYMAAANHRDFIVAAVHSGDQVYHKIGLIDDYVNDAAIITKPDSDLVLVIFTNGHGTYNWPDRAELMKSITRDAIQAYL